MTHHTTLIRKRKYIRKYAFNKTYKKKHTKREHSKKIRCIKILFCAFILVGAYQYSTITTRTIAIISLHGDVVNTQIKERVEAATYVTPLMEESNSNELSTGRVRTVEEQIRKLAAQNNFNSVEYNTKSPDYLVNLACCEGLLKTDTTNSKNNNPYWSIDRGLYGINNHWHKEVSDDCAFDLECSTLWTIQRLKNNYYYEWMCDRKIRYNKNYTKEHTECLE